MFSCAAVTKSDNEDYWPDEWVLHQWQVITSTLRPHSRSLVCVLCKSFFTTCRNSTIVWQMTLECSADCSTEWLRHACNFISALHSIKTTMKRLGHCCSRVMKWVASSAGQAAMLINWCSCRYEILTAKVEIWQKEWREKVTSNHGWSEIQAEQRAMSVLYRLHLIIFISVLSMIDWWLDEAGSSSQLWRHQANK